MKSVLGREDDLPMHVETRELEHLGNSRFLEWLLREEETKIHLDN